jgi:hypothetical protein
VLLIFPVDPVFFGEHVRDEKKAEENSAERKDNIE